MMKINIEAIKETLGATMNLEREVELEATQIHGQEIIFSSPCQLNLLVINSEEEYVVSGEAILELELACSRCLEEFKMPLEFQFQAEVSKEEVESNQLALRTPLLEEIQTTLPMQAVCAEDCQGLCPSCGKNLNYEDCDCYEHEVDPRMAKLGQLLDDDK